MKAVRYSKQRELILHDLQHRYDHPTAEMVFQSLKHDHPELSLGTVYRNLNLLVELNEIMKIDVGDGLIHFDGNIQDHAHFYCKSCKKIYDHHFDQESYHPFISLPHQIDHIHIILTGTCEKCKEA